jgi:hypothetical protein
MHSVDKPAEAVEELVDVYKRLIEGPYRAAVQLALAARAVSQGQPPPDHPLMLGEIDGLLDGWHSELGQSLRWAASRDLRNTMTPTTR